ncbi:asparagine synthase (glutamine-hydrolyzing) [Streptomyces sp. UNOC14_S4]|uniref:asparagine synthase (glutamine-hydrolyzing) n=1 Tax=Streptomyces sp. UNOC14_S4 TaxID=2872340 RepID=UPI001E33C2EE|nr:asparagine synthase (glutamine-hydrolyzing) [Streptomyces sp. UNOC14_S4]MCC3770623.1 asparagine synthase (glutamine-hydrolyzing) [Streptomyces sp. UNOC14_S4]
MCGIVGRVDFDRDLRSEWADFRRAVDTMGCRGPDAEGMWLEQHVALGHRRLAVIDLVGGAQPMVAEEDGHVLAALTYSGEVYNFRELRTELEGRGHLFRTRSDTEVVLRAYLEWGAACAERLNGMYAFAVWDARKEELLLVRDRLGVKPLYYAETPSGVLFGSEPKAILESGLVEPVVTVEGIAEALSVVKTPTHAVFRDIHEVRPGHIVRVHRNGVAPQRYWALEARPHTDDLATTIATVRELLTDTVKRQLVSDVPLSTLLSGGLDSSAVTGLAAAQGPIRSYDVDFAGYTENFTPSTMRSSSDAPYVADVVRHLGNDHVSLVLDTGDLMDTDVRSAVLRARDLPLSVGDLDTSLYLLFRAVRERSTVALSGEAADELFGGYRWFHDEDAVHAGTFPWLVVMGPNARGEGGLLDRAFMEKIDVPGYVRQRYAEALAEVPRLEGETGLERRMREIGHLHLTRMVAWLLDRKDRMSMASGLEVRVPFCDHRLVEYVFNTPWSMKTFDGREKSLLRAAASHVLPRSVVDRKKSPYPVTQDPTYTQAVRKELRALLADPDAPIAPFLDRDRALAEAGRTDTLTGEWDRFPVESVLQWNAWLKRYGVRLEV